MAGQSNVAPVIIKRKQIIQGGGHHGGAWKVAYADFVTAMMAFFMLMWLLNATTDKQRTGIADYFSPSIPEIDKYSRPHLARKHRCGCSIPCFRTSKEKSMPRMAWIFLNVAGPGIEPGSGGYEPPEVPLLYPAICVLRYRGI